jgi:pilus assembly protein CpaF
MFTIVISERGGAERRETFDKGEINVGRVQGNDLMLPKGNVSKHHARILYRDQRFIVTDLKSTNGTYVNGRKISQATLVREGDKIYVGDFVLRVEAAGRSGSSPEVGSVPTAPQMVGILDGRSEISHYPLENDPDGESPPETPDTLMPRVPAAPRVPQAVSEGRLRVTSERAALGTPSSPAPPRAPAPSSPRESPQAARRRIALIALVDRVADAVDLAPLAASPVVDPDLARRLEQAVRDQARAMKADGEAAGEIDVEALARDAMRELVGLGPLEAVLEDDEVDEIHVLRPDCVLIERDGASAGMPGTTFTSEAAVARIVARLAHGAGAAPGPGDARIERRLPGGARLLAVAPSAGTGWAVTIRKPRVVEASLDNLVQAGGMIRAMASFLEACVAARANVLVVGAGARVCAPVVAALAAAFPVGQWAIVLEDTLGVRVPHAQAVSLAQDPRRAGAEAVRAAAAMGADRLVIVSAGSEASASVVDVIGEGSDGVVMGFPAPSLRHGLGRLAAQVALAHPGASPEAAREAVCEAFDVAIEVGVGPGGRVRVSRLVELAGADARGVITRDLFASAAAGEGASIGPTARLTHDFAARGVKLDAGLFKRAR